MGGQTRVNHHNLNLVVKFLVLFFVLGQLASCKGGSKGVVLPFGKQESDNVETALPPATDTSATLSLSNIFPEGAQFVGVEFSQVTSCNVTSGSKATFEATGGCVPTGAKKLQFLEGGVFEVLKAEAATLGYMQDLTTYKFTPGTYAVDLTYFRAADDISNLDEAEVVASSKLCINAAKIPRIQHISLSAGSNNVEINTCKKASNGGIPTVVTPKQPVVPGVPGVPAVTTPEVIEPVDDLVKDATARVLVTLPLLSLTSIQRFDSLSGGWKLAFESKAMECLDGKPLDLTNPLTVYAQIGSKRVVPIEFQYDKGTQTWTSKSQATVLSIPLKIDSTPLWQLKTPMIRYVCKAPSSLSVPLPDLLETTFENLSAVGGHLEATLFPLDAALCQVTKNASLGLGVVSDTCTNKQGDLAQKVVIKELEEGLPQGPLRIDLTVAGAQLPSFGVLSSAACLNETNQPLTQYIDTASEFMPFVVKLCRDQVPASLASGEEVYPNNKVIIASTSPMEGRTRLGLEASAIYCGASGSAVDINEFKATIVVPNSGDPLIIEMRHRVDLGRWQGYTFIDPARLLPYLAVSKFEDVKLGTTPVYYTCQ